jgi:hypothetical protein
LNYAAKIRSNQSYQRLEAPQKNMQQANLRVKFKLKGLNGNLTYFELAK